MTTSDTCHILFVCIFAKHILKHQIFLSHIENRSKHSHSTHANGFPEHIAINFVVAHIDKLALTIQHSLRFVPQAPIPSSSLSCAYPSWPNGDSLCIFNKSMPNSYISDKDLFPDDSTHAPFLYKAPAPPRPAPSLVAMPVPPLCSSKKLLTRRTHRKHPLANIMMPISESPETTPSKRRAKMARKPASKYRSNKYQPTFAAA